MKSKMTQILKGSYSAVVRTLSHKKKDAKIIRQVIYLMSFPKNDTGLIEKLSKEVEVVVCYTKACKSEAKALEKKGIVVVALDSPQGFYQAMRLLAKSAVVVADNYFAFLGDISFSKKQTVFQLWHATGAIKNFGLEDKATLKRSQADIARFKRVYASFDYVFVASKRMGQIFADSYDLKESQMIYSGFPRTDILFEEMPQTKKTNKRTIVYLPTYRPYEDTKGWLLDIEKMSNQMGEDDELYIKLHPHVNLEHTKTKQVVWVDKLEPVDQLIKKADVLITDYSSVVFDYTLIHPNKKFIMYWPDEVIYNELTGLQKGIRGSLLSQICHTTDEVLVELNKTAVTTQKLFNKEWNTYNDSEATKRVIEEIKKAIGE